MKENKITINNLIYALLFFVFGIILLTSTSDLISIVSKIIGSILILIGIVKSIIYIYMKGKLGDYKLTELIFGLLLICSGSLLIMYSSVLSFAIRTVVGLWVLFNGINRIIFSISIKRVDNTSFKVYITTSLLMVGIGICLLSGLVDKIIGLFIIGYAVIEIINYIFYKVKNKNYEMKKDESKNTIKIKNKRLKDAKVIDAIIEEEKN